MRVYPKMISIKLEKSGRKDTKRLLMLADYISLAQSVMSPEESIIN